MVIDFYLLITFKAVHYNIQDTIRALFLRGHTVFDRMILTARHKIA